MCGRAYSTYTDEELWLRYITKKQQKKLPDFAPNYNLSPTQMAPVVRVVDGERQLELFRWGLIPAWSPEFATRLSTINAKSETVFDSRLYKGPVTKRRCIVPLSGFIEWKGSKSPKTPYCIHLKDEPIMSVAGIYERWGEPGKEKHSFSILTTEANSFMEKIHRRMPVILEKSQEEAWLDPENQDPKAISKLMKPFPSKWLDAYAISPAINSPRNNRKELLEPVSG